MFKKSLCLLLFVFLGGVSLSQGQEGAPEAPPVEPTTGGDSPGTPSFWQASLPGGHYRVALSKIVSISRHKYLLDAAMIVDEVTIDTEGQALTRFYFITPITDKAPGTTIAGAATRAKELTDELTQKVAAGMQNMVIKKYPETTHAKTIEYRLMKEETLTALYASVEYAWVTGKGRHFKNK